MTTDNTPKPFTPEEIEEMRHTARTLGVSDMTLRILATFGHLRAQQPTAVYDAEKLWLEHSYHPIDGPRYMVKRGFLAALSECVHAPDQWISVEEGLPETDDDVLICDSEKNVGGGFLTRHGKDWAQYFIHGTDAIEQLPNQRTYCTTQCRQQAEAADNFAGAFTAMAKLNEELKQQISTYCGELCAAKDRIAALEKELASSDAMLEAQQIKFEGCPHSPVTCACSHDAPSDVCAMHAPQLTKALDRIAELESALAKAREDADAYDTAYSRLSHLLDFLDRRGGLGLDVHDYIKKELTATADVLARALIAEPRKEQQ